MYNTSIELFGPNTNLVSFVFLLGGVLGFIKTQRKDNVRWWINWLLVLGVLGFSHAIVYSA